MRLVGGEVLPLLVLLRLEGGEVPLRVQLEGGEPFPITRTIMLINTNLLEDKNNHADKQTYWRTRTITRTIMLINTNLLEDKNNHADTHKLVGGQEQSC